jgi:hypothetical protein
MQHAGPAPAADRQPAAVCQLARAVMTRKAGAFRPAERRLASPSASAKFGLLGPA